MKPRAFQIGTSVRDRDRDRSVQIDCDDRNLKPHVDRPWFRAYAARQLGLPLAAANPARQRPVEISDDLLSKHSLVAGATGSGKTRALIHLVGEQLAAGYSAVVLDPKGETTSMILARAAAGLLAPAAVTVLDPRRKDGVPGWNPL